MCCVVVRRETIQLMPAHRRIPLLSIPVRRVVLWTLIALLVVWHIGGLRKMRDEGRIPLYDFVEYWAACRIFIVGGNPYNPSEVLRIQRGLGWTGGMPIMMWNPPWTIPLMLPFSSLPYWTGRCLWFLFSLGSMVAVADWFWRWYGGPIGRRWVSWIAVLFFIPAGIALYFGQISPLVLAGIAGFLWALSRKRLVTAGAFLLLVSAKPQLLYLFWLFLMLWVIGERLWPILYGALAAAVASALFLAAINPDSFRDYFQAIYSSSGPVIWQTPTWGVALLMLFPRVGELMRFLPSLLGIATACWLWRSWRHTFDWADRLPTIILLSITTSSFTWIFDWIVLIPIVVLILVWFQADPARFWWLLLGLIAIMACLAIQQSVPRNNFYTLWLPPTLWLLYWVGSLAHRLNDCREGVL